MSTLHLTADDAAMHDRCWQSHLIGGRWFYLGPLELGLPADEVKEYTVPMNGRFHHILQSPITRLAVL